MMLFNLLKKDVLIIKKYVLIMLAAAILIPPFILWRAPEFSGKLGFILSVIFCVLMLLQYVSLKEYQFPKAATLLCITPFSRKMMVLSKYVFCMAIFVACCVIYAIETLVIPGLGTADVTMYFIMLFVTSVFIGVYLPIQYKLGYEKTRFICGVVMVASPFILPYFIKEGSLNFDFISAASSILVCGGILLASCVVLAVSATLSVKIYGETELA